MFNLKNYMDDRFDVDFTDVKIYDCRRNNQKMINNFKFREKIQNVKDAFIDEAEKAGGLIENEYFDSVKVIELIDTCVKNNIEITFKYNK